MKRREFITLLGGAAAWPLSARAQPGERVRSVGVLQPQAADDPENKARLAAFRQELQRLGWVEGRNLRIVARWGAGSAARIHEGAAELVALSPDVILTSGAGAVAPLMQVTRIVPIVFVLVADPVADVGGDQPHGLVVLARRFAQGRVSEVVEVPQADVPIPGSESEEIAIWRKSQSQHLPLVVKDVQLLAGLHIPENHRLA